MAAPTLKPGIESCSLETNASPANDLEAKHEPGESAQPLSGWSMDPKNPVNWTSKRKWGIVSLLWGANIVTCVPPCSFRG